MRVFVYGTLKEGHGNHQLLHSGTFIGTYTTPPKYSLYDVNGRFPAMTEANQGVAVTGEIYQIDGKTLSVLDLLEGVPDLYYRKKMLCGKYGSCFTYFMRIADVPKPHVLLADGRW